MKRTLGTIFAVAMLMAASPIVEGTANSKLKVRIKDVTRFQGQEKYTLVGYGLVTGLNGTGDSDENLPQSTINNLLQNFNIVVDQDRIKAQNTAAVTVTAIVEHTAHKGDMISCTVAAIGDSTSLEGGELLLTPLLGTDAETWAISQGAVTTGAFSYGSSGQGGQQIIKNVPTVGFVTSGTKILRDIGVGLTERDILTLYLTNPDYTSAVNLSQVINNTYLGSTQVIDASTVQIRIPRIFREEGRVPSFISEIEQMEFHTDERAKVVFNERTGTIVIGSEVKISKVAICHGNIMVNIKNIPGVSQPNAFSETGTTEVINDQRTEVNEQQVPVFPFPATTTVGELVSVLNALMVTPRDIMVIFHVLKESGALHAELESM